MMSEAEGASKRKLSGAAAIYFLGAVLFYACWATQPGAHLLVAAIVLTALGLYVLARALLK